MPALLRLVDEVPGQPRRPAGTLTLASERVTAREIIRRRVEQEVSVYNRKRGGVFDGLIQPLGSEPVAKGFRLGEPKTLSADEQIDVAISAFGRNRIVLLLDDRQIERLDEVVTLTPGSTVTFLRLFPLVGG